MQPTSKAYKSEQKQHLREKSYVWVYLGVVDRTAQKSAQITSDVTDWSKLPTGNDPLEGIYATYEQDFFRVDGSQKFPPETWAMYQGAASAEICDSITFEFEKACHLRGITLKFYEDATPVTFEISNGNPAYTKQYTYDPADLDENGKWSCEDEFPNSEYITIRPISLKGGNQRFRILNILFGKGFYFSDKELLSTSRKNTVAHLSDKLPSKSFSFSIDNTSRKFSADDPHSFVHFLQEQQEVDFDYGRELPDGSIYTVKGGKTYLKTWTSDDQKATFNSVGYLDFMDTTYYKGQYYKDGISLYDLAVQVFTDAGITRYKIDSFLKSVITHNPLPVEKHKNLLQLIANAGMCVFYEDRDGVLTISSSFEAERDDVYSNGQTASSDLDNLFNVDDPSNLANYTSSYVSDENGEFSTNPTLTIEWETDWTWYNMALRFFIAPLEFTVKLYNNGTLVESFDVEEIDTTTLIEHDFYEIDKMELIFTKTQPNQRIYLSKILFGNITDYRLQYQDLLNTPSVGTTEFVKNVVCHFYEFSRGSEYKELGRLDAHYGYNILIFQDAASDLRVNMEDAKYFTSTYTEWLEPDETMRMSIYYGVYEYECETYSTVQEAGYWISDIYDIKVIDADTNEVLASKDYTNEISYKNDTSATKHLRIEASGYQNFPMLSVEETGAHYIIFLNQLDDLKVVVRGRVYDIMDREISDDIRNIGVDKTSQNLLIDNYDYANRNLAWIKAHYANDVEYELNYRGEPAIDCDDEIYLENKFVSKNLIRVTEETLETSQGMSNCTLKARRMSYKEMAKVDYAIVDVSEVE